MLINVCGYWIDNTWVRVRYLLPCQDINWARCPHLTLIAYHMAQTLIIYAPNKNICMQLFAINTAVQRFRTVVVVTSLLQLFSKILKCVLFFMKLKWCTILVNAMTRSSFSWSTITEYDLRSPARSPAGGSFVTLMDKCSNPMGNLT